MREPGDPPARVLLKKTLGDTIVSGSRWAMAPLNATSSHLENCVQF